MNRHKRTARVAGLWYLGLAISGMLGFLVLRPGLYVESDAAATLANLADSEAIGRLTVAMELAIVTTQALAAVWFYKLFRPLNAIAAWSVAAFALANALIILVSAMFVSTAVAVAGDPTLAPGGDAAATVQLLFRLSGEAWAVGAVFFGLWLIPMGHVAATSNRMPRALGWVLMVGGVGYVASAFVDNGVPNAPGAFVYALTVPATVGEFWMIAFLLVVGLRPADDVVEVGPAPKTAHDVNALVGSTSPTPSTPT